MNKEILPIGINGEHGYPLHTHEKYEIVHYFEGEGYMRSSCGDLPLAPGNIILIPPNVPHGTDSVNGFRALMMTGDFGNLFNAAEPTLVQDNADKDAEALARMILKNRLGAQEYLGALQEAYLHFVLQHSTPEDAITAVVRRIAGELSERFFEFGLSPVTLLKESGYAEDYIRAHFKKVMGKTPIEFLTALRVDHAVYLIEHYKGALTLSEVAARCGFADYAYFSKKFKKHTGISPKDYKRH
ncbi:MAG: helix-turn-helix domain-containing protein [Clostridia bacterium]|nr:helix-turn-helix domain-containing protein [Clostridia bacterium]